MAQDYWCRTAMQLGRHEEAEQVARRMLTTAKKENELAGAKLHVAEALIAQGKTEEGRSLLKDVIENSKDEESRKRADKLLASPPGGQ